MKFNVTLILIVLLLSGCSDDDKNPNPIKWKKLGLDGKTVNEMQLAGGKLYVATTTGLFSRQIDAENNDFLASGFNNKNVEAIQVLDEGEIIVSIVDKSGAEAPALYKSSDDGETWDLIQSNFGGTHPEGILDLAVHPENKNILLGTGQAVVAKSTDQGVTWEPIYGFWGGLATGISVVVINPNHTDEMWAGGQGAIENGFLIRSVNETDWDAWSDLVPNPTVVKEITFTDRNEEELLVGFEGGLLKTSNGGDTWQTLINSEETNKFFFGICVRNDNPDRIYAGGWLKTPDPWSSMSAKMVVLHGRPLRYLANATVEFGKCRSKVNKGMTGFF